MINRVDRDGQSLAIRTEIKVLARRVHAFVANTVDSLDAAGGVAHSAVLGHVPARVTVDNVIELRNLDKAVVGMLLICNGLARFADIEIWTFDTFLYIRQYISGGVRNWTYEAKSINPTAAQVAPRIMSHTGRGCSGLWSRSRGYRGGWMRIMR